MTHKFSSTFNKNLSPYKIQISLPLTKPKYKPKTLLKTKFSQTDLTPISSNTFSYWPIVLSLSSIDVRVDAVDLEGVGAHPRTVRFLPRTGSQESRRCLSQLWMH